MFSPDRIKILAPLLPRVCNLLLLHHDAVARNFHDQAMINPIAAEIGTPQ